MPRSVLSAGTWGRSWRAARGCPSCVRLARERAEAGIAGPLLGTGEAPDVADFRRDRVGEDSAYAEHGHNQRDRGVVGAEGAQLGHTGGDPDVQFVDHRQTARRACPPGLGQLEARQQFTAGAAVTENGHGLPAQHRHGTMHARGRPLPRLHE